MSTQINNPLHGITLQNLLTDLVDYYGWEYLAEQIEVRCFMFDPSIKSSLKFLRKTQWARDKVEAMYLAMLKENVDSPVTSPVKNSQKSRVKSSAVSPAEGSEQSEAEVEDPWEQWRK